MDAFIGLFQRSNLEIGAIVLMNILSVTGVIAVNKIVYQAGFQFASLLMTFHFLCTWMFVVCCKKVGVFEEKRVAESNYRSLGLAQMGSVAFVNLSLMYNTVGTYQLLKFTNILIMAVIEFFWLNKTYNSLVYASLVILVMGISLATVSQVGFSAIGIMHGLIGAVATAVYQILNKKVQSENSVNAMQLLQFEQPYTALFCFIFSMFTDELWKLPEVEWTSSLVSLLLFSGLLAFGVNVSVYLIIGKTSPITYGVIGHTKTMGVLFVGYLLGERLTAKQGVGVAIAFAAIVLYTHMMTPAPKAPLPQTPTVEKEKSDPPTEA